MNDSEMLEMKIAHLEKDFMSIIRDINERLNILENSKTRNECISRFPNDEDIKEGESMKKYKFNELEKMTDEQLESLNYHAWELVRWIKATQQHRKYKEETC